MKVAMGLLAAGAFGAGLIQIPKVTSVVDDFLRPTFSTSSLYEPATKDWLRYFGLALGTAFALSGITVAYRLWVKRPAIATAAITRFKPVYELFVNKWYFDELIDALVIAPALAAGRFARYTFERLFVDETLVGGTTGVVRAGSAAVRAIQSGFIRYYAALLVLGVAGVGFYFLLQT